MLCSITSISLGRSPDPWTAFGVPGSRQRVRHNVTVIFLNMLLPIIVVKIIIDQVRVL